MSTSSLHSFIPSFSVNSNFYFSYSPPLLSRFLSNMLYDRRPFCPSLKYNLIHLLSCLNTDSLLPHVRQDGLGTVPLVPLIPNSACCWLRQRENKPPFDIIHPPPWVKFSKLYHQKLVARILSHFADPAVISKWSPSRGTCGDVQNSV
jgi:hypothetical protein